ncbi:hypothetical protein AB4Z29_12270 [Paenibacillus sp. 2TAB23]|uniref:hypothetical protein n=1 Tax=Paenibacillus sp. 2TAB23 TaxID=3233004 RepID=UPI003F9DCFC8
MDLLRDAATALDLCFCFFIVLEEEGNPLTNAFAPNRLPASLKAGRICWKIPKNCWTLPIMDIIPSRPPKTPIREKEGRSLSGSAAAGATGTTGIAGNAGDTGDMVISIGDALPVGRIALARAFFIRFTTNHFPFFHDLRQSF